MHPSKWSFLLDPTIGRKLWNLLIVFPPARSEDACCGRPRSWTETVLGKCLAWKGQTVWWTGCLFPLLTWWVSHVFDKFTEFVHQPSLKTDDLLGRWDSTLHEHWEFEGETSHSVLLFCFGSQDSWHSWWHNEICASHKFIQIRLKNEFQISVIHSKIVVVTTCCLVRARDDSLCIGQFLSSGEAVSASENCWCLVRNFGMNPTYIDINNHYHIKSLKSIWKGSFS